MMLDMKGLRTPLSPGASSVWKSNSVRDHESLCLTDSLFGLGIPFLLTLASSQMCLDFSVPVLAQTFLHIIIQLCQRISLFCLICRPTACFRFISQEGQSQGGEWDFLGSPISHCQV